MNIGILEYLIIFHILICIIYLILFFRKGLMYKYIFPLIVFFPYLWVVFVLIAYFFISILMHNKDYDKSGLVMQIESGDDLIRGEASLESNIVPVEEALILNDNDTKRQMVIEIAKRDPTVYLENLKLALLSEDSETAHYAASSISKLKMNIDKSLREARVEYEEDKSNISSRVEYIRILDFAIKSALSVDVVTNKYIEDIIDLLELHVKNTQGARSQYYEMLITYLIEAERVDESTMVIDEFQNAFSEKEEPLICKLENAYLNNNQLEFNDTINEINEAKFPISKSAMELVEFWQRKI